MVVEYRVKPYFIGVRLSFYKDIQNDDPSVYSLHTLLLIVIFPISSPFLEDLFLSATASILHMQFAF